MCLCGCDLIGQGFSQFDLVTSWTDIGAWLVDIECSCDLYQDHWQGKQSVASDAWLVDIEYSCHLCQDCWR